MAKINTTTIFAEGGGAIIKVRGSGAPGLKVDGFPTGGNGALILIDSIDLTQADIAIPVVAADDYRIMYTFGKTFGNAQIRGRIFLGCGGKSGIVKQLESWFDKSRISSKKKPVNVSIASGKGHKVYINGMTIGGANPANQTLTFTIMGHQAPKP